MPKKPTVLLITLILGLPTLAFRLNVIGGAQAAPVTNQAFVDQRESVRVATYWLVSHFQNDDGGYASLSTGANQAPSSISGTLDAILAIAAAGYNPGANFPAKSSTPIDYLLAHEAELAAFAGANGGQAGKVVLALTSASVDPRIFSDHDFVNILADHLEPSGAYNVADPFKQSLAILGVAATGQPVSALSVNWLKDKQAANGSWDDGFGTANNPDTTALAIMALLAAGLPPVDTDIQSAVNFLAGAQLPGGWEYGSGFGASANSTALVIQALSALGEDWYSSEGEWVEDGHTPLQAIMDYQSLSGAFQSDFGQGRFDDFYATVQAIPAVAGRPYPLPARFEAARAAISCLGTLQDNVTGGWPSFAGNPADAQGTSRAIQAISAFGGDVRALQWTTSGGIDAAEALESLTPAYLSGGRGGRVGIVMQGVIAAGPPANVRDFAGEDLPLLMTGYLSPTGEYDSTAFGIFAHGEAMLGLLAAKEPVAPTSIDFLLAAQSNGDWGDPDSNGIALQVLNWLSHGTRSSTMVALRETQNDDGGWGFGGVSNPSTSSEVVQGLSGIGLNPLGPDWSRVVNGRLSNAADIVMAQQGNNGCWPNAFGPGDDPYSTTDAILLLTRQAGWGFSFANLPFVTSG